MRAGLYIVFVFLIIISGHAMSRAQSITINNDLTFGDMFPGVPKEVPKYTAGSAAEFHVSGTAGSELSIEFTLPTYMHMNGFNMQLVFPEDACAMDSSATPDQSSPGYDDIDPWHPITYRLGFNGLTIWLGGMVIPKIVQIPGDYTATIVLTVTYTGN
ncbi:MAG: hypothetical protein JXA92_09150 [candidate division Zixibacteria bacterium]|nr:hypothetical protein [candidate division Zixibacteria bacterium]